MKLDFTHYQSAHCENGVVSNLLKNKGYEHITEPLVFGIGSGLFFVYIPFLKVNYAPAISYRPMPGFIFKRFAKRTGIKIKRNKFRNQKKAQLALDKELANDNPVGLQVGVYHLTYYPDEYRFHFNAHNLVVCGKEGDNYLISDPVLEDIVSLSSKELERVRFAKGAFAPKGHIYYPTEIPKELDLQKAILKGIKQTCKDMTAPVPIIGVNGMRTVAKLIRKWSKKYKAKKVNHYLGQIVRMQEEIGTGGGGFRFIYGAFLQEASDILDNPKLKELSKEMTAIGDEWRDFAINASRIYKNRSSELDAYDKIACQLEDIADKEEVFFKKLKKAI